MIAPLHDEFLLVRNGSPFLIVAVADHRFSLCIESSRDEYCQTVGPGDLIAVSAPEGGEIGAGVMLIELVRRHHTPLIVLPKDHPGSKRLKYVVSAGPVITTNCNIVRGTHPEQHLICASEGLSGLTLRGATGGVEIRNLPEGATVERFSAGMRAGPPSFIGAKRKSRRPLQKQELPRNRPVSGRSNKKPPSSD